MAMSLLISGCGDSADSGATSGKRDDVIIQINGDITSFDPFTQALDSDAFIYRQLYDTLIHVTADRDVELRLAESYEVNADSSVFTFKLKDGIKFHNGDVLKASDVVFTFEHYMESPFLSTFVGGIESATDIGNNTVQIKMHAPNAAFLNYCGDLIPILSQRAVTEAGDNYDDAPVGTGPYKYVSYARANQINMTRFDDYYRGPARIKDITFRIMSNPSTAVIALQAGDIDFSLLMSADYENVSNDPNLTIGNFPVQLVELAIMNHTVAPFDNVTVRQAVSCAVDREFILEAAAEGHGVIATNILPPGVFGYSPAIETDFLYDPGRAKDLLAQAGITTPLDIGTIITIEQFAQSAQILHQNLRDIGLNADLEVMEFTRFGESLMLGDFTIASVQLGLTSDADSYAFLLADEYIGGMNYARYNNPAISGMFAQGRSTADLNERIRIYTELFSIVGNDVAYLSYIFPYTHFAWNSKLNAPSLVTIHVYEMYWS